MNREDMKKAKVEAFQSALTAAAALENALELGSATAWACGDNADGKRYDRASKKLEAIYKLLGELKASRSFV